MEKRILRNIDNMSETILKHKNKLFRSKYEFERRYLDKEIKKVERKRNEYIKSAEKKICHTGCLLLYNNIGEINERETGDNIMIMRIISNWGNWNKMYKNLSVNMMKRGFYTGIYIELLSILKNPSKIGLDMKHVQLENDILNHLSKIFIEEQKSNKPYTYIFLNFLYRMYSYTEILNHIYRSIKNLQTQQCGAFRNDVGFKKVKIVAGLTSMVYYAHYDIPKSITYDLRLMMNVNHHFFNKKRLKSQRKDIYYGVFLTTKERCKSIMNKDDMYIVKRDVSTILYPLTKLYNTFKLHSHVHTMFNNMLANVFTEKEKRGMKMGLIVDLEKLSQIFTEDKTVRIGMQMNDIFMILVHHDIPKSCIVDFIEVEKLK
jgi:hypothetical protein